MWPAGCRHGRLRTPRTISIALIGRWEAVQIQTREPRKSNAQNLNAYFPMNGACLDVETAPCCWWRCKRRHFCMTNRCKATDWMLYSTYKLNTENNILYIMSTCNPNTLISNFNYIFFLRNCNKITITFILSFNYVMPPTTERSCLLNLLDCTFVTRKSTICRTASF